VLQKFLIEHNTIKQFITHDSHGILGGVTNSLITLSATIGLQNIGNHSSLKSFAVHSFSVANGVLFEQKCEQLRV